MPHKENKVIPEFPTWAPPDLCKLFMDEYQKMLSQNTNNLSGFALHLRQMMGNPSKEVLLKSMLIPEYSLMYRLIYDKRMETVWKQLNKRLTAIGWDNNKLFKLDLGIEADDLKREGSVGALLLFLILDSLMNANNAVKNEKELQELDDLYTVGNRFTELIEKNEKIYRFLTNTNINPILIYGNTHQTLTECIKIVIARTKSRRDVLKQRDKYILPYKNIKSPIRTAFIRCLALAFQYHFKQKMYGTIATVTSVILMDNQVDESIVRDALRRHPVKSSLK